MYPSSHPYTTHVSLLLFFFFICCRCIVVAVAVGAYISRRIRRAHIQRTAMRILDPCVCVCVPGMSLFFLIEKFSSPFWMCNAMPYKRTFAFGFSINFLRRDNGLHCIHVHAYHVPFDGVHTHRHNWYAFGFISQMN